MKVFFCDIVMNSSQRRGCKWMKWPTPLQRLDINASASDSFRCSASVSNVNQKSRGSVLTRIEPTCNALSPRKSVFVQIRLLRTLSPLFLIRRFCFVQKRVLTFQLNPTDVTFEARSVSTPIVVPCHVGNTVCVRAFNSSQNATVCERDPCTYTRQTPVARTIVFELCQKATSNLPTQRIAFIAVLPACI